MALRLGLVTPLKATPVVAELQAGATMRRFNPVQQMIRGQHPFPSAGATGVLRLADLPQSECSVAGSLLEFLLNAGADDGHWIITSRADGEFHYELTLQGARFLRDAGDG